jgi:multidrug efflux system membrane fusion protein
MLKETIPSKPSSRPDGHSSMPATAPPMHIGTKLILVIVVVLCVVGIVWKIKQNREDSAKKTAGPARGGFATPVVPGTVRRKDIPIYLDGLGTVQAYNTVTLKSRVDGQLNKVAFSEGQDVHQGDLIGQIDPLPYKAALEQAAAKKKQDEAQLANAQLDLKRDQQLVKDKIVTDQALATQQALVDQLVASVAADQAGIDSAQVQLDYTSITSPLEGRCGIRQVDQGNIVHATDTNGLVIITQLKPIFVVFTLPEQYATQIAKKMMGGTLKVLALDRDNKTSLGIGTLSVIDNQIDPTTGTVKLKASFPNEDLLLWPGQFVNSRVLVDTRNGLVVPAAVIQRGPDNEFAFVIDAGTNDDLVAKIVPVKVAQIEDGQALLEDDPAGLQEGQKVVVDGQYKLQDGSKVKIDAGDGAGKGKGKGAKKTKPAA